MTTLNIKPTHASIKAYYDSLSNLSDLNVSHEGAVSPAFATLLRHCAHQFSHTLVEKYPFKPTTVTHTLFIDGAVVDSFNLVHGYWEAKDTSDDLDKEIKKKFGIGYPKNNILFQAPNRIVIWQDGQEVFDEIITNPDGLVDSLKLFFGYEAPAFEQWHKAVEEFKLKVRELAAGLLQLIEKERQTNQEFVSAFEDFVQLCQETINPNISVQAVEEMLIQHLLTERIFRKVFNNPDFAERNVIAREIEKVITSLTSHYFSRNEFLKPLDRFYGAIETTAATIDDFTQKQGFLNTVYEKFFQGFSVKVADTHGIVYTPQPIVSFMVKSVERILQIEFGRSLSDNGVNIIDPFVGTGNFILSVMHEIQRSKLAYKYANELHCNEVMLLPYYIASMNIEHEYYGATGDYVPFPGICLVDSFDLKAAQTSLFSKENTARVKRQQATPIFVVVGNPPYNAGQVNENDNNKNRKYPLLDKRVSDTYAKGSKATLLRKLSDPYVKAIRWASDRIKDEGIVALVTNNSFVNEITFDGMRRSLQQDFDAIYILDLGGNVRKNPKLSGTTHNVFGIQVGVSINLFVKKKSGNEPGKARIFYASIDPLWRKEEKYDFLNKKTDVGHIDWQEITPDSKNTWLTEGMDSTFDSLVPMGTKEAKALRGIEPGTIFKTYSLGVGTNRDEWVYAFRKDSLENKLKDFIANYNSEVFRLTQSTKPVNIDEFVNNDPTFIKWTDRLKTALKGSKTISFDPSKIRLSLYRPFCKQHLYFDDLLIQRRYLQPKVFPIASAEVVNKVICVPSLGGRTNFWCFCANCIPNLTLTSVDANQCFPLYTYSEDGASRDENITDWTLDHFRANYQDAGISKEDVFHYVYVVLHHPQYRKKYATNLKRELPRIPLAPDFWEFAKAGKQLVELHVNYEAQADFPLKWLENNDVKVNYRVERMALSKDKTQIAYNDFLTLSGIPPEVFEYRLGNRSALEWIIDQYQVSRDKRSGIVTDPNRLDDPQYIIHLVGKVITVSLKTVEIIQNLPPVT